MMQVKEFLIVYAYQLVIDCSYDLDIHMPCLISRIQIFCKHTYQIDCSQVLTTMTLTVITYSVRVSGLTHLSYHLKIRSAHGNKALRFRMHSLLVIKHTSASTTKHVATSKIHQ